MDLKTHTTCYTVYGYASSTPGSLTGFNGEPMLKPLEQYALGAGHRLYSPSLMRFLSADSVSPFGKGGLNAYAYCVGDPVNRIDPTGQNTIRGSANRRAVRTPSPQRRGNASSYSVVFPEPDNRPPSYESPPSYKEAFSRLNRETQAKLSPIYRKIMHAQENAGEFSSYTEEDRQRVIQSLSEERDRIWNENAHLPGSEQFPVADTPPTWNVRAPAADTPSAYEPSRIDTRPRTTLQDIMHNVRATR